MNHEAYVALCACPGYERDMVDRALDQVLEQTGFLNRVKEGMRIGIKANLVTFKKPEAAATTHPSLLLALVSRLKERGAEVIVGDSPGGVYNAAYLSRVYHATGMKEVETVGGSLNQDFSEGDKDFPEGMVAKNIHYTTWIDECDMLINFSKLKTHGMMGMSCAAKNMFGLIPGTYKPEYHFRYADTMAFARMIVDLNDAFPCDLYLVDAIVGMEGNGPTAGTPRKIGCLLGSEDPHALDTVCAAMIGLDPKQIPTIVAAMEKGYTDGVAEHVCVSEAVEPYVIRDYKNIKNIGRLMEQDGNVQLWGKMANQFLITFLAAKPGVVKEECIGCGECGRVCPAHAIEIVNKLPVIDRKACIRCFCCQEFCPKGAMKVKRPLLAKVAGKL